MRRRNETRRFKEHYRDCRQPDADRLGGRRHSRGARGAQVARGDVEDYDLPGLKTENGIADVGFALMAWIVDPGKNALAIIELKG